MLIEQSKSTTKTPKKNQKAPKKEPKNATKASMNRSERTKNAKISCRRLFFIFLFFLAVFCFLAPIFVFGACFFLFVLFLFFWYPVPREKPLISLTKNSPETQNKIRFVRVKLVKVVWINLVREKSLKNQHIVLNYRFWLLFCLDLPPICVSIRIIENNKIAIRKTKSQGFYCKGASKTIRILHNQRKQQPKTQKTQKTACF